MQKTEVRFAWLYASFVEDELSTKLSSYLVGMNTTKRSVFASRMFHIAAPSRILANSQILEILVATVFR